MTTETAVKPSRGHEVARVISIVVHPITLPLVTLGALTYLARGGSLQRLDTAALAAAVALVSAGLLITALPVALLVLVQVLRGRWTDPDVSVRRQRYLLYPFGVACMLATAVAFIGTGAPLVAVRGAFGVAGTNAVNGLINLKYKVSAHAATAALCAALLWLATPLTDPSVLAWPVTFAAVLVGWSRVALGRHTVGQVILGWCVGVGTGVVTALLPWPLMVPAGLGM